MFLNVFLLVVEEVGNDCLVTYIEMMYLITLTLSLLFNDFRIRNHVEDNYDLYNLLV